MEFAADRVLAVERRRGLRCLDCPKVRRRRESNSPSVRGLPVTPEVLAAADRLERRIPRSAGVPESWQLGSVVDLSEAHLVRCHSYGSSEIRVS